MNKDQVKGRIEKAVGKLKEAAGISPATGPWSEKAGPRKRSAVSGRATETSRTT